MQTSDITVLQWRSIPILLVLSADTPMFWSTDCLQLRLICKAWQTRWLTSSRWPNNVTRWIEKTVWLSLLVVLRYRSTPISISKTWPKRGSTNANRLQWWWGLPKVVFMWWCRSLAWRVYSQLTRRIGLNTLSKQVLRKKRQGSKIESQVKLNNWRSLILWWLRSGQIW